MTVHLGIPKSLNQYFEKEIKQFSVFFKKSDFQNAWYHLERAHILGQAYPFTHSRVHWLMLIFGFKTKNTKEILGQLPRLFFGGVKSFVGVIPVGNTGGTNIPPLKPLPIPAELLEFFKQSGIKLNNK